VKPGDLITGKRHKAQIRLIVNEYYKKSGDGLPPSRVFKIIEANGNIEEWGADNVERYWGVIQ